MRLRLFLAVCVLMAFSGVALAASAPVNGTYKGYPVVRVEVNGAQLNPQVPAIVLDGVTMLPLRAVADSVGATLDWDSATWTASLETGGGSSPESDRLTALETQVAELSSQLDEATKRLERLEQLLAAADDQPDAGQDSATGVAQDSVPVTQPTGPFKPVFPGYFKNVDYSDPGLFLQNGQQTQVTSAIQGIAGGFNEAKDLTTVTQIYQWMRANLTYGDGEKFGRTSQDILSSRMVTGCTDNGLAFVSLARAKEIPCVFVQTGRIDWIQKAAVGDPGASMITGHILAEVYVQGKWYLVDTTAGKLYQGYDKNDPSLPDGYYVFAKSIEVWDSGAKNEQENASTMLSIFRSFNPGKYADPRYDYIDLMTGETRKSVEFAGDSTVIGATAVIVGQKEPVELFNSIFTSQFVSKSLCGFLQAKESAVTSAARLVLLFTSEELSTIPDYFFDIAPEMKSPGTDLTVNLQREGRRLIIIRRATQDELLEAIHQLPSDFLDRDSPSGP